MYPFGTKTTFFQKTTCVVCFAKLEWRPLGTPDLSSQFSSPLLLMTVIRKVPWVSVVLAIISKETRLSRLEFEVESNVPLSSTKAHPVKMAESGRAAGALRRCAVKGCSYSSVKLLKTLCTPCLNHKPTLWKDCGCDLPYIFFCPRDKDERQWLAKLLLKNPPKGLYVCSYQHSSILYLNYISVIDMNGKNNNNKNRRILTSQGKCAFNMSEY